MEVDRILLEARLMDKVDGKLKKKMNNSFLYLEAHLKLENRGSKMSSKEEKATRQIIKLKLKKYIFKKKQKKIILESPNLSKDD